MKPRWRASPIGDGRGGRHQNPSDSVFDSFAWWDPGDVLTQVVPARYRYIRSAAGPVGGQRILDLGCGGGMLSEPMARDLARVHGIDISRPSLQTARGHAVKSGLDIHYAQARAEALPYRDGTFDLTVAFDVLEHVSNPEDTVAEVSRVLRPGGKFVYDTVNRTLLSRLVVIWIGEHLWKGGPPKGTHQWHKFIRPEELMRTLARCGIDNVETRGLVPQPDLRGRLTVRILPFKGISYVGYGVKRA